MENTSTKNTSSTVLEFIEILNAATPEQKEAVNAFVDNLIRIRRERTHCEKTSKEASV